MRSRRSFILRLVTMALLAVANSTVIAGDITATVSSRQTSVDMPVTVQITVADANEFSDPVIPEIPGVAVQEMARSRSSLIVTRGGQRRVEKNVVLGYTFTPSAPGTMTIPAITIIVDGEEKSVGPFSIAVKTSGPLVMVEVVPQKDSVYVGEPLSLTLRLLIKPFREPRLNRTLSEGDMWSLVDLQHSEWGGFESVLRELSARDQRPTGKPLVRTIDAATNETYYAYELRNTVWPRSTADLGLGEIAINVKYPLGLQEDFMRISVTSIRQVSAQGFPPEVTLKPIPTENRPAEFRGAVGTFTLSATAQPEVIAVGEPITLTISITDQTRGGADLASLSPPPLAENADLIRDFRMPNEPLAGDVKGKTKTFLQTIRPLRETVEEVPPIRFAFFDPATEKFVSLASNPLPIQVRSAQKLSASEIVDAGTASQPERTSAGLTELAGGIRANVADPRIILAQPMLPGRSLLIALLAIPPLGYAVGSFLLSRRDRLRGNPALLRRRNALAIARRRLHDAQALPPDQQAGLIAAAIGGYVTDRLDLPPGATTRPETMERLRAASGSREILDRLDGLLRRCEQAQFAGPAAANDPALLAEASACLDLLSKMRLSGQTGSREAA